MNSKNRNNNIFDIVPDNNGKEVAMKENTVCNETVRTEGKKSNFGRNVFLIGTIALLIGFFLVHWKKSEKTAPVILSIPGEAEVVETATPAPGPKYDSRILRQQIEMLTNGYQADCSQIAAQYMNLLESNVDSDFSQARNAIPRVVDDLCGFKACVKLSYKAAKDKLKDTHDFQDAYMEMIDAPIVQPSIRAHRTANDTLQMLDQCLKERYARYAVDLAAACDQNVRQELIPPSDLDRMLVCINNVAAYSQQYQREKLFASLGVVFEAIFFRQTCSAIVKLFAKPVAKICGSLGIGGICAAADGPIPVGDIVGGVLAFGGLAWTAYDIYDVTCVMPKHLESELRDGIDETRKQLLSDCRSQVNDILQTYQYSGNALKAELVKELR